MLSCCFDLRVKDTLPELFWQPDFGFAHTLLKIRGLET
jgi:hypothetical protein